MRFLITAARDPNSAESQPADAPFSDELFASYMKFNDDLTRAGVLVTSEGIHPAGHNARVGIAGGRRVVLDGPFTETKELVGGFYLIDVKSREEAIEWALRCPTGAGNSDILTIYQMVGAEDFPPRYREIVERVAPAWRATWTDVRPRAR